MSPTPRLMCLNMQLRASVDCAKYCRSKLGFAYVDVWPVPRHHTRHLHQRPHDHTLLRSAYVPEETATDESLTNVFESTIPNLESVACQSICSMARFRGRELFMRDMPRPGEYISAWPLGITARTHQINTPSVCRRISPPDPDRQQVS